jgi:hypothetical protein
MSKELLPLEERIKQLEQEVQRLRKLLESHLREHGVSPPILPDPTKPLKRPFEPGHPDVGPPKEY